LRTLEAELTTAQKSASRTPYIEVKLRSRNRATTREYKTTDATNRVLGVQQSESRYDGVLSVPDSAFPISTIIQIQDSDQAINDLDFKGYRADIGWGYNTTDGNKASHTQPSFVVDQRSISLEGSLIVELYCVSMWGLMRTAWQKQTAALKIRYEKTVTVRHILMELFGGRPADAVILDDGGAATNLTAAALNPTDGADFSGIDDVALLPAVPAVNDALYIGDNDQFDGVSIDRTVPAVKGSATYTLVFEYWNGSAYTALSNVVDETSEYTESLQLQTIKFDRPTNWATSTEHSLGPHYYMRIRVSAANGGTPSTRPFATKIVLAQDYAVSLDSNNSDQGDDDKPQYASDLNQDISMTVQDILANTLLGVVVRDDGFHMVYVDDDLSSIDYIFKQTGGDLHPLTANTLRDSVVIPNRISYLNKRPGEGTVTFGSHENTTSSGQIGRITDFRVSELVTSSGVGDALAERAIKRLNRDSAQGTIEAPMECGLEIWDVTQAQDDRSGLNYSGRISQIVRTYEPGVYQITVGMGDTQFSVTPIRMGILAEQMGIEHDPTVFVPPPDAPGPGEIMSTPVVPEIPTPKTPIDVPGDPTGIDDYVAQIRERELAVSESFAGTAFALAPTSKERRIPVGRSADPQFISGRPFGGPAEVQVPPPTRMPHTVTRPGEGGPETPTNGSRAYPTMSLHSPVPSVAGRRDPWTEYSLPRPGQMQDSFLHVDGGTFSYMRGTTGIGGPPVRDFHVRGIGDSSTVYFLMTNSATGHTNDDGFYIHVAASRDVHIMQQENDDLYIGTNDIDRIKIDQDGNVTLTQYIGFVEVTDPAASANTGRLYAKDNGSGKTQLVVRFGSGAVQVIATEP
jgi:hypothetical protein